MAFTVSELLLTEDKRTQLAEALSNIGIEDPLGQCITEAEGEVADLTAGYTVSADRVKAFVRAIALYKAYGLAEAVPEDVKAAWEDTLRELRAIASGERSNLPRSDVASAGAWYSETKISARA